MSLPIGTVVRDPKGDEWHLRLPMESMEGACYLAVRLDDDLVPTDRVLPASEVESWEVVRHPLSSYT